MEAALPIVNEPEAPAPAVVRRTSLVRRYGEGACAVHALRDVSLEMPQYE